MRTPRAATQAPTDTVSLYVRLSREAAEEGTGLVTQEADLRRLAADRGLTVVGVHVDDGESGSLRNRPGLLAWFEDAREGRADHLAAWKLDRVSRGGMAALAAFFDVLDGVNADGKRVAHPVRFLTADGMDSTSATWDLESTFKGAFAKEELKAIRARIIRARTEREAQGRWNGGPPPYGYRPVDRTDGPGKTLAVVPEEAALIREAAARVLAGENLSTVVRYANSPEGRSPRRAAHWSRVTLRQVLTGSSAAGRMVRIVDGVPVPVLGKDGAPVTFPAILDADESAALRAALDPSQRADASKGGRRPSRLLSGILRCDTCNAKLTVVHRKANDRGQRDSIGYRCMTRSNGGQCASPVLISSELVDDYIAAEFLNTHGDHPTYTRRAEVVGAAAIERAEDEHTAALAALAVSATPEAFGRLQAAQQARTEALSGPQHAVVRVVPTGRTFRQEWEATDLDGRRELVAANCYGEIFVRPGKRGGVPALDPARLLFHAPPAHVVGESEVVEFMPGGFAVQAT